MKEEFLYVEEGTGLVKKVTVPRGFWVLSDEPYKPNGKCIFVNPETNLLEEGKIETPMECVVNSMRHGRPYRKLSDFISNENSVFFHPDKKEFAEVKPAYNPSYWQKVRDFLVN